MKTIALTAAAALAMTTLATPAFAQSVERDTAPIGSTEFMTSAGFQRRDTNRDGVIDANEYEAGERARYDRDGDGQINETERAAYDDDDRYEGGNPARPVQQSQ